MWIVSKVILCKWIYLFWLSKIFQGIILKQLIVRTVVALCNNNGMTVGTDYSHTDIKMPIITCNKSLVSQKLIIISRYYQPSISAHDMTYMIELSSIITKYFQLVKLEALYYRHRSSEKYSKESFSWRGTFIMIWSN